MATPPHAPEPPAPPSTPDALSKAGGHPVVIFDGVCNLCNRAVQLILDHDRRGRLLLAPSQSDAGRALVDHFRHFRHFRRFTPASSAGETIFLVEEGRLYERSAAVLRIARALGFPWSLLFAFVIVPRPLRDLVYGFVSRNRYRWFGKRESCRLARPGELERFLT